MIRQQAQQPPPGDTPGAKPSPAVSELMRMLDEKAREAEKLKGRAAELEKIAEKLSRQPAKPSFDDDSIQAIDALRARGEELYGKGILLEAFYIYRRIIRLDPHDLDALHRVATIYHSAGMSAQAAEVLEMMLEIDPANARAARALRSIKRRG